MRAADSDVLRQRASDILAADEVTAVSLKEAVLGLFVPHEKRTAAQKLNIAAHSAPDLFGPLLSEAMVLAFEDADVGDLVIDAFMRVPFSEAAWDSAQELAVRLAGQTAPPPSAFLVLHAMVIQGTLLAPAAASLLIPNLDGLIDGRGDFDEADLVPLNGGPKLELLYELMVRNRREVLAAIRAALNSGDVALAGQAGIAALWATTFCGDATTGITLGQQIVRTLYGMSDARAQNHLSLALAVCIGAAPEKMGQRALRAARAAPMPSAVAILGSFSHARLPDEAENSWLPQLVRMAVDGRLSWEHRCAAAAVLHPVAESQTERCLPFLDVILSTLATATLAYRALDRHTTDYRDRLRAERQTEDRIHRQATDSILGLSVGVVQILTQVAIAVAKLAPESTISAVAARLRDSAPVGGAESLLAILGYAAELLPANADTAIALVYPYLSSVAPWARAAAAESVAKLAVADPSLIPDAVVRQLNSLVDDEWVQPVVASAIWALRKVHVSGETAAQTLDVLERMVVLATGSAAHTTLLPSACIAAWNVGLRNPTLSMRVLRIMLTAAHGRNRHDVMESLDIFGAYALGRREFQAAFINSVLGAYRRMGMQATDFEPRGDGLPHMPFEYLYLLERRSVSTCAEALHAFGESSQRPEDCLEVAQVLAHHGLLEPAQRALASLAERHRLAANASAHRWALGCHAYVAAEKALVDGNVQRSHSLFDSAAEEFARAARMPLADDTPSATVAYGRSLTSWAPLRARWTQLNGGRVVTGGGGDEAIVETVEALVDAAAECADRFVGSVSRSILHGALQAIRSARCSRRGEPGASRLKRAALIGIDDAVRALQGDGSWTWVQDGLNGLRALVAGLPATTSGQIVHALARIAMPVPTDRRPVAAKTHDLNPEDDVSLGPAPTLIAEVRINGIRQRDHPAALRVDRLHEVVVDVEARQFPAGVRQLKVQLLPSTVVPDAHLPADGEWDVLPGRNTYSYRAQMRFQVPQENGAVQIRFDLVGWLRDVDGRLTPVTVVGDTPVSFAIIATDGQPEGSSVPAMGGGVAGRELPVTAPPPVILSAEERSEFERAGMQSQTHIRLTGRREGKRASVVELDGKPGRIGDAPLKRLILLVAGLYSHDTGWLPTGENSPQKSLVYDKLFGAEDVPNALSRMRGPFHLKVHHYLTGEALAGENFIQHREAKARIATHRRFISWDEQALRDLGSADVTKALERLIEAQTNWQRRQPGAPPA